MPRTPVTQPDPSDIEYFEAGDAGDINDPPADALLQQGYSVAGQTPSRKDHNWHFRELDKTKRFLLQRGIFNWSATETYEKGDLVRYENGGVFVGFFVAFVTAPTVGQTPTTNEGLSTREWERYFVSPHGGLETQVETFPIIQWGNARGFKANEIDRLGFFGGPRVSQWLETWRSNDARVSTGTGDFLETDRKWAVDVTDGGSGGGVQILPPTSPALFRHAFLAVGSGGGSSADLQTMLGEVESNFHADLEVAMEFVVLTGSGGVSEMRAAAGMSNAQFFGDVDGFVGGVFAKGNGDANWIAITGDGSTRTTVDTGVAVAVSTSYLMRIEWIGSGKAVDTTSQMRFYINGLRVARITTELPLAAATKEVQALFGLKRDTGTSLRAISIGPVRFSHRY